MARNVICTQRRKQRGTVSAVAALSMVSLLLFAGMAIDVSHLYLAGGELQNAADASAIAGAASLNGFPSGITNAVDRALAIQNKYEFGKNTATFTRSNVLFAKNLGDFATGNAVDEMTARGMADRIRFIQVLIPNKSIGVNFASLALGTNQVALSRKAIAGFSAGLQQLCNSIVPLPVTQAPLDVVGSCPNNYEFTPGCTYIIRRGSNGHDDGYVSAGNFLILAFGGNGGAEARLGVAGNPSGCYKPGDIVGTEPGITAAAVRQGMNTRFDVYTGSLSPADAPPDMNVKEGITYQQYRSELSAYYQAASRPGREGRRIIILPIVNVNEYDEGRDTVRIHKFAAFFMQKKVAGGNGGDITAEYITGKIQVADGSFTTGTSDETQFTVPVIYK
jgi:Flp pilus assembly protein TadG